MATRIIRIDGSDKKDMLFAYTYNQFYIEMSRLIPTVFKDDLDVFFVLAAITNCSISAAIENQNKTKKFTSDHTEITEAYSFTKLLPLSEITGLPRTTVRRKAEKLMELGFVEHVDGMGYRIRRGAVSKSVKMRSIIRAQTALVSRLLNDLLALDLIGIVDVPGGGAAR